MATRNIIPSRGTIKIVGLYLLLGFLWILFSDKLLAMLVRDPEVFLRISTYKGWGYVLVTGALLYILIKRHTDRLMEGENWLSIAYEAAEMGTWRHDMTTGMIRFDERARGHYGFDSMEVPYEEVTARTHAEDLSRLEAEIARTAESSSGGRYSIAYRVTHPDGNIHWLGVEGRVSYKNIRGKRRPIFSVGTSREVTENMQAELRIRYFARLYATLSQVNQTIVRSRDRQELFDSICKVAVEFGEFKLAWIGLLDSETGLLTVQAEYGSQKNKLPFKEINVREEPYRDGLIGLALKFEQVETSNDIWVDPRMSHWRETALQGNYHSAAAIPIRQNGKVTGLLNLFASDIDFFMAKEEQKLLEEMSMDISFALDTMQLEAERKQAERELVESERRYHQVLDNMMEGCQIIDHEWRYVYINDALEKHSRAKRSDLLGRTMMEAYPGIENTDFFVVLRQCMERRISTRVDNKFIFPDGSVGWFELSIQPFEDGVFILSTEITERKRAETRLLESEERFHQLADNIEETFWIYDPIEKKEDFISPAVEKIWMLPAQAFFETPSLFTDTIVPADRPFVLEAMERQALGEKTDLQYRISCPDGSIRWVWDRAFPVFDNHGKVMRVAGIVADITEIKNTEMELLELNQNLEQRVRDRTAELHAANIALEKASKLKDEFLANMSHELRTPLNGVISLSESLHEGTYGELSARQKEILDVVGESGQHLLELINDILDLSKIEAGKLTLQYDILEIKGLCESSIRMVREPAQQKELRLSASVTDEVQTIYADSRRLKQMLVNLLSNAVKFTPQGGSVSLEVQKENEHAIRFSVRDTGIGITPEHLQKLFNPFTQLDSSYTRKYEGTGLGLALVRQLAEIHGGGVGVESEPGMGSCFYFTVPIKGEYALEKQNQLEDFDTPKIHTPARQAPATILLAEDNPTNMMVTFDYLTSNGFTVITAVNGIEALEQAQTHRPDIILMDIQMPGVDGLEAIRRLRAAPEFDPVPIIALTALAMPGDRELCLQAGANEYLAKPVSLKNLAETISDLLK
ncbi:MAG: PAS domain-containing protein [Anaerolineales bacterium]|nr:PAS domain-containing protein [Anaerolineales bacterium]